MTTTPSPDPLGPEWGTGPDGVRTRSAARVLVLDDAGRVLLVRGSDPANRPGERWWFPVGGGIGEGEDARTAAVRELAEETGIAADPAELQGPVLRREPEFGWLGQRCRQRELVFVLRLARVPALDRAGWTELERATLEELRWWGAGELAATGDTVYPPGLAAIVEDLRDGWDGLLRDVG